jgi:hypothetical protein
MQTHLFLVCLGKRVNRKVAIALFYAALATSMAAVAQTKLPQELRGARSLHSDSPESLSFLNASAQPIKIYWLNFKGQRVFYQTLQPGEVYDQETFLTHPWVVTDENDNAWALFYAPSKVQFRVTAPSMPAIKPAKKPRK